MTKYETCKPEEATHFANKDRSIVHRILDMRGERLFSLEHMGIFDSLSLNTYFGLEPVREVKERRRYHAVCKAGKWQVEHDDGNVVTQHLGAAESVLPPSERARLVAHLLNRGQDENAE